MNSLLIKYITIILISFQLIACIDDEIDDPEQEKYLKVGELLSSESTFNVGFYAKDSLFVGYNKVFLKIKNQKGGSLVKQATIALYPLMDMGTFSHACPVENPGNTPNPDGYFEGAVLFSMIGTDSWSLSVDITADGKTETVFFPIDKVKATNPVKKIVVIDSLSNGPGKWTIIKHPLSLVEPPAWKVGKNVFEFTAHTMESMMNFPICSDLSIEIIPEMPSMGHGSPNNVHPVYAGNGHYKGTVNFTMTGDWRIHLKIKKGDRLVTDKAYFDILF